MQTCGKIFQFQMQQEGHLLYNSEQKMITEE